jgi:hypothetical protein
MERKPLQMFLRARFLSADLRAIRTKRRRVATKIRFCSGSSGGRRSMPGRCAYCKCFANVLPGFQVRNCVQTTYRFVSDWLAERQAHELASDVAPHGSKWSAMVCAINRLARRLIRDRSGRGSTQCVARGATRLSMKSHRSTSWKLHGPRLRVHTTGEGDQSRTVRLMCQWRMSSNIS